MSLAGPVAGIPGQSLFYIGGLNFLPTAAAANWIRSQVLDHSGTVVALGAGEAFSFTPTLPGAYKVMFGVASGSGAIGIGILDVLVSANLFNASLGNPGPFLF